MFLFSGYRMTASFTCLYQMFLVALCPFRDTPAESKIHPNNDFGLEGSQSRRPSFNQIGPNKVALTALTADERKL